VKLSDGSCQEINYDAILNISKLVDEKGRDLKLVKEAYDAAYRGANCTQCPGAADYFAIRLQLIHAHNQFLAAVRMFLQGMKMYEQLLAERRKLEDAGLDGKDGLDGPEFVPGKLKRRPHCVPWSYNITYGAPSRNFCGVLCRLQPNCVGFAMSETDKWCIWYDEGEVTADNACSSRSETEYVKKRQGPLNEKLWTAIKKVDVFETALQEALAVTHLRMEVAEQKWHALENTKTRNKTVLSNRKDQLVDSLYNYSDISNDADMLQKQLSINTIQAFALMAAEEKSRPPFKSDLPPSQELSEEIRVKPGLQDPPAAPPKALKWSDFPNSQDTRWSQLHPDCPQGVPCFCDCKCRGAPPQNFVEPPPPAYTPPCPPPPPLPNPFMMSSAVTGSFR
jgi:hypothetical protein